MVIYHCLSPTRGSKSGLKLDDFSLESLSTFDLFPCLFFKIMLSWKGSLTQDRLSKSPSSVSANFGLIFFIRPFPPLPTRSSDKFYLDLDTGTGFHRPVPPCPRPSDWEQLIQIIVNKYPWYIVGFALFTHAGIYCLYGYCCPP